MGLKNLALICWLMLYFHYKLEGSVMQISHSRTLLVLLQYMLLGEKWSRISSIRENTQVLLLAQKNTKAGASFITCHHMSATVRKMTKVGLQVPEFKAAVWSSCAELGDMISTKCAQLFSALMHQV